MEPPEYGLPWITNQGGTEIRLRRLAPNDLAAFQRYRTDESLARYQGWKVESDAWATDFLEAMHKRRLFYLWHWFQLGICTPAGLVGDVGILVKEAEAEIGYTLSGEHHGKGIATTAVQLALYYIFAVSPAWRVLARTHPDNTPSIRLLERVGFALESAPTGNETSDNELVYAMPRSAFTFEP